MTAGFLPGPASRTIAMQRELLETSPDSQLVREDQSLLKVLTFIWSGFFVVGVVIYSCVAWWTANQPLGHGG